ncbi:hypothetical protein [Vagococcus salmoninarum]|uniref:hypothetical protein n=1 Tax=Vagococcus salmoninarum TaxID=2739 RepID=UPI0028D48E81|nr:hypothetical protein [Vagococcus salmoninarum]
MSITKEIIIKNPIGEELPLSLIDNQLFFKNQKYKEVFVSESSLIYGGVAESILQVANHSMTLSNIAKHSPNGLFTATVDPTQLSKFKNGSVTTMVRDASGKVESHAGFTEVGLSNTLNPAMALSAGMQIMSLISGTYYLHKINIQLAAIDHKLEELVQIHHDENIGKLIAARKGLSEISEREFVDQADLYAIRSYKKTVNEIQEEYSFSLHRKKEELLSMKEIDQLKIEDINFYMSVIFESSKISLLSEVIEIGTRMKIGGQSEIIESLTKQLEKNYKNSFYFNSDVEFENLFSKIKSKIMDKKNKQKQNSDKIDELMCKVAPTNIGLFATKLTAKGIILLKDNIDHTVANKKINNHRETYDAIKTKIEEDKMNETIGETISEVLDLPYKKVEILYVPDNEKQRIFVPVQ